MEKRGVKDILIICADDLSGMKEAIPAAYPKLETELGCDQLSTMYEGSFPE